MARRDMAGVCPLSWPRRTRPGLTRVSFARDTHRPGQVGASACSAGRSSLCAASTAQPTGPSEHQSSLGRALVGLKPRLRCSRAGADLRPARGRSRRSREPAAAARGVRPLRREPAARRGRPPRGRGLGGGAARRPGDELLGGESRSRWARARTSTRPCCARTTASASGSTRSSSIPPGTRSCGSASRRASTHSPGASPAPGAHVARAALFVTLAQVEAGVGCPLSMTHAAGRGARRRACARWPSGSRASPRSRTTRACARRPTSAARSAGWR